jgi:hypothetical protein
MVVYRLKSKFGSTLTSYPYLKTYYPNMSFKCIASHKLEKLDNSFFIFAHPEVLNTL